MLLKISLSEPTARALRRSIAQCARGMHGLWDQSHTMDRQHHARAQSAIPSIGQRILNHMRQSPGTRSIAYLGTAALISKGVRSVVYDAESRTWPLTFSLVVLPFGTATTYVFVRVIDQQVWLRLSVRRGLVQAIHGAALGGSAFLGVAAIAAACGWVSTTAWGWQRTAPATLIRSVALLSIGHLAVAINEEMVFRGYGFETLGQAVGPRTAATLLTVLFALYHYQFSVQGIVGPAASGLALQLLRLSSDGLWMPIGYHWAWNVTQTALLGPSDGLPSLRPLAVHGPSTWIGRPGYPEPGVLSILVNLVVAAGVCVRWWSTLRCAH